MATIPTIVTEETIKNLCLAVFDRNTIDSLKITLPSEIEIPVWKQFYIHYQGQFLKYDLQESIIRAAMIFEYSKQEVNKYISAKEQLTKLNNPLSFFNTNLSGTVGGTTNAALNTSNTTNKGKTHQLNIGRADNTNIATANGINRAGSSQLNEEYSNIEDHWKKSDLKYDQIKADSTKELIDIKLPKDLEDIDLNSAIINSDGLKLDKAPELLEEYTAPNINYTGLSINKSLSSSVNKNSAGNKALNTNVNNNTNSVNAVNTGVQTNKSNTNNLSFVYGDAVFKSLDAYVANFKEAFFSSFACLFIEPWTGYS